MRPVSGTSTFISCRTLPNILVNSKEVMDMGAMQKKKINFFLTERRKYGKINMNYKHFIFNCV